ncbi:maltose alpha-D-glucosyltransferase [Castellaniella ginsengisoli]|uniref:maltose alpha-D-glucosyltransferase n=1 Tax=Castellaniella ginsengisoli TaxID=546114 RepID=A0AB39CGT5_9BURK
MSRQGLLVSEPDWYKDAVIYQLHVKSFFDSNSDGVGDLPGLLSRLDYIADLGVTAIWLLPFYPSPRRDDGYDIADYRKVHADYGGLPDLRRLIRAAHARNLRVITELVINHTSDQHAWFQRARKARKGSVARDYYVWSDDDRAYAGTRVIFCDTETSNWAWDPVAQAYYWHRFYAHQPDLNYDNPRVLTEVLNIMRYWLDMGVDGMRLDAVPYLIEREGTSNENLPQTHAILRRIRAVIDAEYPGRMLLAEANQWPEDVRQYFGEGDECHMAFHFPLMPRMYMAIAQEDRFPIIDILRQTPPIPPSCQWAVFLRNHDELTLEMVTSRERDYLWKVYAADPLARLNLGIRRRLAPLMEGDRRRVELMNSLLLSMPGTPIVYYGDELGMGDNIHLGDRNSVRTPMQWSSDRNGGFSRADPERLQVPVLMGPLYGYEVINVEAQHRNPHSLLNWTRRLLACRARTRAFGRGTLTFLHAGNRKILAYLRQWEDTTILCVANLSSSAQPVELPLQAHAGTVPVEMLAGSSFPRIGELPYLLTLPPYGFYWFELSAQASPPDWHVEKPEQMRELVTLVLGSKHPQAFGDSARRLFESEALPAYLTRQRWSTADPCDLRIHEVIPLATGAAPPAPPGLWHCWVLVDNPDAGAPRLNIPVALCWNEEISPGYPIARVRCGSDTGILADAFQEADFLRALVEGLRRAPCETGPERQNDEPPFPSGRQGLRYRRFAAAVAPLAADAEVRWIGGEQSNSSAIVDDQVVIKVLRRIEPGLNPEIEMSGWLTQAGYTHTPSLLGTVEYHDANGAHYTLAVLHRYIPNEGDAWCWTLEFLHRNLAAALLAGNPVGAFEESLSGYLALAQRMGRRLAELHAVFVDPWDAADGGPPPASASSPADIAADGERALRELSAALDACAGLTGPVRAASREAMAFLREQETALASRVREAAHRAQGVMRLRGHGDLHLGQILVSQADAYLIDFEGEPLNGTDQRRQAATIYKDLAGMLRSFDYVAAVARRDSAVPKVSEAPAGTPPGPDSPEVAAASPEELLSAFRLRAGEAFLAGYRDARPSVLALDDETESMLLAVAQLEKAAYEVRYETAHRPEWLPIPLNALVRIAKALLEPHPSSSGGA